MFLDYYSYFGGINQKLKPMRKLLYLSLIFAFVTYSCKTLETTIPKKEILSGINFTKYTKSGFLITPEKYNKEYESIGLIDFLYMPKAELKYNENDNYGILYSWEIDPINIQDALDKIYTQCLDMGANALVNFNATVEVDQYPLVKNPVAIKGYRITGFAIKIK